MDNLTDVLFKTTNIQLSLLLTTSNVHSNLNIVESYLEEAINMKQYPKDDANKALKALQSLDADMSMEVYDKNRDDLPNLPNSPRTVQSCTSSTCSSPSATSASRSQRSSSKGK
jgi:hypothetical protein